MASIDTESKLLAAVDKLQFREHGNDNIKKDIKEWVRTNSKGRIEILVTGRTGTGKSTLVNALVGKRVAATGNELCIVTKNVKPYKDIIEDVEIMVWDSPGLQDGSGKDAEYLAELKENCGDVDIVVYCIDSSVAHAEFADSKEVQNDLRAIQQLTATFGREWWKHSLFVLTRANALEAALRVKPNLEKRFNERIQEWRDRIHAVLLKEGVGEEIVDRILVEPAGYIEKPHLPGRRYWFSALWIIFLKSAKEHSQPLITKVNLHRFKNENDVKDEDFKVEGYKQPIVIDHVKLIGDVLKGGAVGAQAGAGVGAIGGITGSIVGGVVGGAIGVAAVLLTKLWLYRKSLIEKKKVVDWHS